MKLAKSHKIILMVIAVALSLMLALCAINLFASKAETVDVPSAPTYFNAESSAIDENGAKFTVKNGETVSFKNKLAIDDMEIKFGASENVEKLELILTYDSYYVNGNKNSQGKFDKEIVNKFDNITPNGTLTIDVDKTVDSGLVKNQVRVNGVGNLDAYYKIRIVDKAIAKVEFKVTLTSGKESGSFIITDVNQKKGDATYNQSLKTVEGKLTSAKPVISLSADMFVRNEDGSYTKKAFAGQSYALSYTVCSVLNNVATSEFYPTIEQDANITLSENNKKEAYDEVFFKTGANATETFSISYKDGETPVACAEYTVNILKDGEINNAPEYYNSDSLAIESFKAELEKQYKTEEGKFVALGTELEIPSMEDFVYDDRTPYSKLTKKLYYVAREEKDSSTLEIPLENVGEYFFYVLFTDSEDKGMKQSQFVEYGDDEVATYGEYGSSDQSEAKKDRFIFYFNIEEDTEIVVKAPTKQGVGYKGTKYTAAKFEITSSNCNITYKLEYAPTKDVPESEWVEIKKLSDVEEGETVNGYDYETLEKINYNGEYTFTPDKKGVYKITVNVTSKMSFMSAEESTFIEVNEEANVVKPSVASWIQDNVWSVVFLSIGTLCLVGIIVLLFIKPKDKKVDED